MGPMPDLPCSSADQNSSAVFPTGVTAPTPVITTRGVLTARPRRDALPSRLLFDVADGVADRGDLLRVLVGDLDAELLLERHHQLHRVEGVGVEVLDELRLHRDLVRPDSEVLADDLPDPLFDWLRHQHLLMARLTCVKVHCLPRP